MNKVMNKDLRTNEFGWITETYKTKDLKVRYIDYESMRQYSSQYECQVSLDIEECNYYGFGEGETKEKAYACALHSLDKELLTPRTTRVEAAINFGTIESWEAELESVKKMLEMAKRKQAIAKWFLSIVSN